MIPCMIMSFYDSDMSIMYVYDPCMCCVSKYVCFKISDMFMMYVMIHACAVCPNMHVLRYVKK